MNSGLVDAYEKTYNDSDDADEYTDCSSSDSKDSSSSSTAEGEALLEMLLRHPGGKIRQVNSNEEEDDDEERSCDEEKCISLLKTLGDQGRHTIWDAKDYRQKWNEFKNHVMSLFDARSLANRAVRKYRVKFYRESEITGYHDLSYDKNPDSFSYKMMGYFSLSLNLECFPLDMPDSDLPVESPLKNEKTWIDNLRRSGYSNVSIVPVSYEVLETGETSNGGESGFTIKEDPKGKNYEEELGSESVIIWGKCTDVDYYTKNEARKPKLYRVVMKFMGQREDPSYYNTIPRKQLLSFKDEEEKRLRSIMSNLDNVNERLQSMDLSENPEVVKELQMEEEEEKKEESPIILPTVDPCDRNMETVSVHLEESSVKTNWADSVLAIALAPVVKKPEVTLNNFFEKSTSPNAKLFEEAGARVVKANSASRDKKRKRTKSTTKNPATIPTKTGAQPKAKRQKKTKTSTPTSTKQQTVDIFQVAKNNARKKKDATTTTTTTTTETITESPNIALLENFSSMVEENGNFNFPPENENYVNYFCTLAKAQAFALYIEYLTFLIKSSKPALHGNKNLRKDIREKKTKWKEYKSKSHSILHPFEDQSFRVLLKDLVLLKVSIKR